MKERSINGFTDTSTLYTMRRPARSFWFLLQVVSWLQKKDDFPGYLMRTAGRSCWRQNDSLLAPRELYMPILSAEHTPTLVRAFW